MMSTITITKMNNELIYKMADLLNIWIWKFWSKLSHISTGFEGASLALTNAFYDTPEDTPILLDEVLCLGDEEALSQCHHRDWGLHGYCSHADDAGVVCQGK